MSVSNAARGSSDRLEIASLGFLGSKEVFATTGVRYLRPVSSFFVTSRRTRFASRLS